MDPKNIFHKEQGAFTVFKFPEVSNQLSTHSDVNNLEELEEICAYYVHNASSLDDIRNVFPLNIICWVSNDVSTQYDYEYSPKCNKDCRPSQTINHNKLYISATAVVKAKMVDITVPENAYTLERFNPRHLTVKEVHDEFQVKKLYNSAVQYCKDKSSHLIFSIFFKAAKHSETEYFKFHFIEAMLLTESSTMPSVNETLNIFTELNLNLWNVACVFYSDKTSKFENSKHVYDFLIKSCILKLPEVEPSPNEPDQNNTSEKQDMQNDISEFEEKYEALEAKYNNLLSLYRKEKIKNNAVKSELSKSKEGMEKIARSYQELLVSQKKKYDETLNAVNKNNAEKLSMLSSFYQVNDSLRSSRHEDIQIKNENLKEENQGLQDKIAKVQKKIENIKLLVSDGSPETVNQIVETPDIPPKDDNYTRERIYMEEIQDLKVRVDGQNKELQNKSEIIGNLNSRLEFLRESYIDALHAKEKLEDANQLLRTEMKDICTRRDQQFVEYEKMFKKLQSEKYMNLREISRLRSHINSDNFTATSPALLRQVKQQTPKKPIEDTDFTVTQEAEIDQNNSEKENAVETVTANAKTPNKRRRGRPRKGLPKD